MFVSRCVVFGGDKHVLDTCAGTFLAELHLEDGMVDGFSRYLPCEKS